MKKQLLIFLSALVLNAPAFAHRLNEYLIATTINLSRNQVLLEVRLTPGVAIAPEILKAIDLDSDGVISRTEQQRYLSGLQHDLFFKLDGRISLLNLTTSSFPSAESMRKGTGDIIVELEVPIIAQGPAHELELKDTHYHAIAVYLVNSLLPADTTIRVTGQTRNSDQSFYQLDFTTSYSGTIITQQNLDQADYQAVIKTYLTHGIQHILTGYDHLLFLCALVLGAAGLWDLIKVVTAFTIAHSITLTLATFGLAHLPETLVEPMIAASIVIVAVQNIRWPNQSNGYTRIGIAFFFGLFHGLGFAGGLLEIMHAMPKDLIWYAILGFSLGVEVGNQVILLPLYGALQWFNYVAVKNKKPLLFPNLRRYASIAVAAAGFYYFIVAIV